MPEPAAPAPAPAVPTAGPPPQPGVASNTGGGHQVVVTQGQGPPSGLGHAPGAPGGVAGAGTGGVGGTGTTAAAPSHLVEIKSPMVGTFYSAPEPGAEP